MSYIEGFVNAVPKANKEAFIAYSKYSGDIFMRHGALRILESWQDDVPAGDQTDFYRAVACTHEEAVVFSWIEWPDKTTRDAGLAAVQALINDDAELANALKSAPYDGSRMIYGGFQPVVTLG